MINAAWGNFAAFRVGNRAAEFELNLVAPVQFVAMALAWSKLEALVFVTSGYALVFPRRAPTYGAAKAGLHAFAEGLRRQLADRGPHVLEVLPPVVDALATAHRGVKKVSPETVAEATLEALVSRKPQAPDRRDAVPAGAARLAPRAIQRLVAES